MIQGDISIYIIDISWIIMMYDENELLLHMNVSDRVVNFHGLFWVSLLAEKMMKRYGK